MRYITIVMSIVSLIVLYPLMILTIPIGIMSDVIHASIGFLIDLIGNAAEDQANALNEAIHGAKDEEEND